MVIDAKQTRRTGSQPCALWSILPWSHHRSSERWPL